MMKNKIDITMFLKDPALKKYLATIIFLGMPALAALLLIRGGNILELLFVEAPLIAVFTLLVAPPHSRAGKIAKQLFSPKGGSYFFWIAVVLAIIRIAMLSASHRS